MTGEEQIQRYFYSTKEVAKMFGVHRGTIQRMARQGLIPCIKFGNSLKFPRKSVDQVIRKAIQEDEVKAVVTYR